MTTIDDILNAVDMDDDDLVLSPANGANQHNSSAHASNTDVDSIRLEDILNEDSDEGDNNLIFTNNNNNNNNNSINLENDDLINEAREYVRQTSISPNIQCNNNTSPRTSQILQQILDEDEADDTSQFLEFLKHSNDITDDKQSSSNHSDDVNNIYKGDGAMNLNINGRNSNKTGIPSTYSNHTNDVERSNNIDNSNPTDMFKETTNANVCSFSFFSCLSKTKYIFLFNKYVHQLLT
jgi:hypothetical protein